MTTSKLKLAIVVSSALISMALTGRAAVAADECLASPNGLSPQGQHWRYHLDRQTQRKCWYLATVGAKVAHHAAAKPSAARAEESAPAQAEAHNDQAPAPEQPLADASGSGAPATAGAASLAWPDPTNGARSQTAASEPGGQAAPAAMSEPPPPPPLAYTPSVQAAQQPDVSAAPVSATPAAPAVEPAAPPPAAAAPVPPTSSPVVPAPKPSSESLHPSESGSRPFVVLSGVLALAMAIGLALSRWLARRRDMLSRDLEVFAKGDLMPGGDHKLHHRFHLDEADDGPALAEAAELPIEPEPARHDNVEPWPVRNRRQGQTPREPKDTLRNLMRALGRPAA
jgi:hypothetical protein